MTEEMLEVIDENGAVVRVAPRSEVRAKALRHKSVFVILCNSRGEFYLQQRSSTRPIFPLLWEAGASGAVPVGESFEDAAKRELEEELGIRAPLRFLFGFKYEGVESCLIAEAFLAQSDDKVTLSDESEQGKWVSRAELEHFLRKGLICPDTTVMLKKYLPPFD